MAGLLSAVAQGREATSLGEAFCGMSIAGVLPVAFVRRESTTRLKGFDRRIHAAQMRAQRAHSQLVLILDRSGDRSRPPRRGIGGQYAFALSPVFSLLLAVECALPDARGKLVAIQLAIEVPYLPQHRHLAGSGV
jgi:hypothetical protein